jgi:hypothetical protein
MGVKSWPGGFIQPIPPTPAGPFQDGAAKGIWTLDQVAYWLQQGLWPIAGNVNTGNIGLFAGGSGNVFPDLNVIDRVVITTTGNATDFGDLTLPRYGLASCASSTRGLFAGGNELGRKNIIDYVTIATNGNATDFGDLTQPVSDHDIVGVAGCNSSTRGVFGGGNTSSATINVIQYVTIASTGNSIDFGDLTIATYNNSSCSSSTRGIFGGGNSTNVIGYITIASVGNAVDFGDLTTANEYLSSCSNSTRGLFAGGSSFGNRIDYITIATTGNALDFGDMSTVRDYGPGACSNATRGLFAGGYTSVNLNSIVYVTIATTGNSTSFGDMTLARNSLTGCSGGNGGVQ